MAARELVEQGLAGVAQEPAAQGPAGSATPAPEWPRWPAAAASRRPLQGPSLPLDAACMARRLSLQGAPRAAKIQGAAGGAGPPGGRRQGSRGPRRWEPGITARCQEPCPVARR